MRQVLGTGSQGIQPLSGSKLHSASTIMWRMFVIIAKKRSYHVEESCLGQGKRITSRVFGHPYKYNQIVRMFLLHQANYIVIPLVPESHSLQLRRGEAVVRWIRGTEQVGQLHLSHQL